MFFAIILAIVITAVVAFLIVKYLPLKLRWIPSLILLAIAIFLGYKIYNGIMSPINFNSNKEVIYAKIVKRLKVIRDAEVAHKEVTGKYTKNIKDLIKFIDTAQFALTETKNVVEKVNKGTKWQPIMVEVERRVTDTIGYEPVLSKFAGRNYKEMYKVPDTDKLFSIELGTVEKVAGLKVDVFEIKVAKKDVLVNMDASLVNQEIEAITNDQIKGEFISVGSLNEVTIGGNWPPFYDKADRAKKSDK